MIADWPGKISIWKQMVLIAMRNGTVRVVDLQRMESLEPIQLQGCSGFLGSVSGFDI